MKPLKSVLFTSLLFLVFALPVVASLQNRQLPPPGQSSTETSTSTTATTHSASLQNRQLPPPGQSSTETSTSTTATTTSETSTSTTTTETSQTTTSTTLSETETSTTTPPPPTTTTPPPQTDLQTTPSLSQSVTVIDGVQTTVTVTGSATVTSSSETATATNANNEDEDGGISTGSIIGMSVAGGVAVIGIIAFFVWKFTRKRFADFDDNEAIKWPDLNSHSGAGDSHPLPVKSTGRSGFDTGSDGSLSRVPSNNYSTADVSSSAVDPYAVPPLPHMNPNQPYRDDPTAVGGYYDPYRGPVPGTIEHGGPEWVGGEAIPMNQMGGRMSPGPHVAYGAEPVYDAGRQSPGPQMAYGGRSSPGPQAAYGGRMSPGPHAAYGRAVSPAPPPAAGYDAYGGR
ncbi:unnamed protein product [Cyclocybe aegerita]|uniref:Uncharacterized protein n=1 Tax=Cyclocybe aegerita TaxID=1973307 RepID=A0A8S0W321_CYCAE|nr:unnamed protein product [Cyclocybe aegerita]